MSTTYTETQQRVRRTFGAIGAVLVLGMAAGIVVSLNEGTTLAIPFAVVLLALGLYFLWAGLSGFIVADGAQDVVGDGAGGILAVGLVFSFLIPGIGLVVGIGLLFRKTSYGALLMVVSLISSTLWFLYLRSL